MDWFQIPIKDKRIVKDSNQRFAFSERLKSDKVNLALLNTKRLLGKYSTIEPSKLSVHIVDGIIGEGTIRENIIKIQIPPRNQATAEIKTILASLLGNLPEDEKDRIYTKIIMALSASTVLHEGVHGLLNSRPDSAFARDLETISNMSNQKGQLSTLLDEGITYAIQAIYAPEVKPLGSLAPSVKETDSKEVKLRKQLGERLRSKVKAYLEQGNPIDNEFFQFATLEIKNLGVENV